MRQDPLAEESFRRVLGTLPAYRGKLTEQFPQGVRELAQPPAIGAQETKKMPVAGEDVSQGRVEQQSERHLTVMLIRMSAKRQ